LISYIGVVELGSVGMDWRTEGIDPKASLMIRITITGHKNDRGKKNVGAANQWELERVYSGCGGCG